MKESLVSLETAKLASEKGFKEVTLYYYHPRMGNNPQEDFSGYLDDPDFINKNDGNWANGYYSAPFMFQLQKWLREEHNTHVWLIPAAIDKTYRAYIGHGIKLDLLECKHTISYAKYEGALEAGLFEALNLIK